MKLVLWFVLFAGACMLIQKTNLGESQQGTLMLFSGILIYLFPRIIRAIVRYSEIHRDINAPVRQVSEAEAEAERNLVTPRLRYEVMKRDGFKCVLCGASAKDGARLHVDHIKPVSKGGKTELYNLRTLCERCNLGKGNLYDAKGIN